MYETILPWVGHASFALSAISFMMRRMLWLRIFAILSGALGIAYNSSIAVGWIGPANPELWNVVGWIGLFFLINVVQSVILLFRNSEVKLTEEWRVLLAKSFPDMKSRDFMRLINNGQTMRFGPGEVIVDLNEKTDRMLLLKSGEMVAKDRLGAISVLLPGYMIGEISFVLHEQYNGSAHRIVSVDESEAIAWSYKDLEKIIDDHMRAAFLDGILRGLVKKNGLLSGVTGDVILREEVFLTHEQKLINAATFPSFSSAQFDRIVRMSFEEKYAKDQEINLEGKIGVLVSGAVRIERSDGQFIDLGTGNLLGEVGFMTGKIDKLRNRVVARTPCRIMLWDRDAIALLERQDPALYVAWIKEIARDMASKLTRPLQTAGNTEEVNHGKRYVIPCRFPSECETDNCACRVSDMSQISCAT